MWKNPKSAENGKLYGGRPKARHTIEAAKAREYLINSIAKDLEPILEAQKESAKGIWLEEKDKDGKRIRVYQKHPALSTGEYLLNQLVGRPKESLEVSGGLDLKLNVL